ncbi:MAG: aldehyde oxidase, partial [Pseudomonadota bacterium]
MIDNPVLITGFSGRALAQSALRAGYTPFVFDAYGDEDTRSVAHTCLTDPSIIGSGLRVKPTVAALETLLEAAGNRPDSAPPPPVLLTSGFESSPKLIAALEQKFNVLSTPSKTVADVKAPDTFFSKLTELGIPHPKTLTAADPDARDRSVSWLSKRIGGMGGLHITRLSAETELPPNYYAQEEISG